MGQNSLSPNSRDLSGTASNHGGAQHAETGLGAFKEELVKDAGQVAGGLRELAAGVAGDAKNAVEGQLDSQKSRVVDGLGGIAQALRRVSTMTDSDESLAPALVPYIEQAAYQVERASAYFETKTLGEVARDVEDFARREPAFFLGGAFALGLLGGRFLKASQPAGPSDAGYGGPARERSRRRPGQRNDRLPSESPRPGSNGHNKNNLGAGQGGPPQASAAAPAPDVTRLDQAEGSSTGGGNTSGSTKPVGS